MKPILFNTSMVRAILDGRKTVTRRVVKARNTEIIDKPKWAKDPYWFGVIKTIKGRKVATADKILPPYNTGDILYVRETWCSAYDGEAYFYFADKCTQREQAKLLDYDDVRWRPSIHMPKEAARIFLRVTNVRVEWLQDITAAEIQAEGLTSMCAMVGDMEIALQEWRNLWDSTIKEADKTLYGWDANPWVWVIEFERITPKGVLL